MAGIWITLFMIISVPLYFYTLKRLDKISLKLKSLDDKNEN